MSRIIFSRGSTSSFFIPFSCVFIIWGIFLSWMIPSMRRLISNISFNNPEINSRSFLIAEIWNNSSHPSCNAPSEIAKRVTCERMLPVDTFLLLASVTTSTHFSFNNSIVTSDWIIFFTTGWISSFCRHGLHWVTC